MCIHDLFMQQERGHCIYDLYAVSNHMGNMGGGHYNGNQLVRHVFLVLGVDSLSLSLPLSLTLSCSVLQEFGGFQVVRARRFPYSARRPSTNRVPFGLRAVLRSSRGW